MKIIICLIFFLGVVYSKKSLGFDPKMKAELERLEREHAYYDNLTHGKLSETKSTVFVLKKKKKRSSK